MIYRDFKGKKISQLAFGTMRLPVINGDAENIDQAAVEKMVQTAFDGGVNYFDTAWGYHNGKSEVAIGKSQWPQACVGCGACESVCPQSLKIPEIMQKLIKLL